MTLRTTSKCRGLLGPAMVALAFGLAQGEEGAGDLAGRLAAAALAQAKREVTYDGSYRKIRYPGGDVPDHVGVCTDLVIRSYRALAVDLQVEVHEDMRAAFAEYPMRWGLSRPDPNIDHRRVLNLQTFLRRRGVALAVTSNAPDYRAGDLVTWDLPGGTPHIGIVTHLFNADSTRPLIAHHLGSKPGVEDMLFRFPITGHYRYLPGRRAD